MSLEHDYSKYACAYSQIGIDKGYYLAFRDIPQILSKLCLCGKEALDYGCGTGRSTQFLNSLGFRTVGVDISENMLQIARQMNLKDNYYLIKSGELPFPSETFDLVFSSFVFLEISTIEEIIVVLSELKRVLKSNGKIIIITAIVDDIKDKWETCSYDFPENEHYLNSGDPLKLYIYTSEIVFYDYNWFEKDYYYAFKKAGLNLVRRYTPLGNENDPYTWGIESQKEYYYIYVLEK